MTILFIALFILSTLAALATAFSLLRTRRTLSDISAKLAAAESKGLETETRLNKSIEDLKKENLIITERNLKLEIEKHKVQTTNDDQLKQIANLKAAMKPDSFDGLFPICSNCKDIRDPKGYWHSIEEYIQSLSEADFSHSLCPECAKKLYPDLFDGDKKAICLKWNPGSDKPLSKSF